MLPLYIKFISVRAHLSTEFSYTVFLFHISTKVYSNKSRQIHTLESLAAVK